MSGTGRLLLKQQVSETVIILGIREQSSLKEDLDDFQEKGQALSCIGCIFLFMLKLH